MISLGVFQIFGSVLRTLRGIGRSSHIRVYSSKVVGPIRPHAIGSLLHISFMFELGVSA